LQEIADYLPITYSYDDINRELSVLVGKQHFRFLNNTSVFANNGVYLPVDTKMLKIYDLILIPKEIIGEFYAALQNNSAERKILNYQETIVFVNQESLIDYLSFLSPPIKGAHLSTFLGHLPNALREYRHGIHEGIDWYNGFVGVEVNKNTPVIAMADGVIVRVDNDYQEMSQIEREFLLTITNDLGSTPAYILDKLRGRSIWIQHDNGVLTRYAHLSKIVDNLTLGKKINKGEIIGYVGNSGTSDGVMKSDNGVHLHTDILLYGNLLQEYIEPEQIYSVLSAIF